MQKRVMLTFEIPDEVTDEQFREWLRYEVTGWDACCSGDNPLLENYEKEYLITDVWEM